MCCDKSQVKQFISVSMLHVRLLCGPEVNRRSYKVASDHENAGTRTNLHHHIKRRPHGLPITQIRSILSQWCRYLWNERQGVAGMAASQQSGPLNLVAPRHSERSKIAARRSNAHALSLIAMCNRKQLSSTQPVSYDISCGTTTFVILFE